MATNRYTQLEYSNLNDLPLLQLPFEQLNELVMASQKSKDEFNALSELAPKYIKDSETDVNLKNQITAYQSQVSQQLADIAAKGDITEYRRQLGNAKKAIVNMWKPGGPAHALEQRYEQEQKRIKDLEEYFKDNKLVREMYQKKYNYNDIEYDPETGGYKSLPGQMYFRDINDEEISKWFLDNASKVKQTLLDEGFKDIPFDDITTIRDFFQIKGVTYDRLVDIFQKTMPRDFVNSIWQKEAALRYFNPSLPEPGQYLYVTEKDDKGNTKVDKDGNVVFKEQTILNSKGKPVIDKVTGKPIKEKIPDMTNPLMKLFSGYAEHSSFRDLTHQRIVLKHEVELERRKLALKKESEASEFIPRGQVANVPNAPEKIEIDDNGQIIIATKSNTDVTYGYAGFMYKQGGEQLNTKVSGITAFRDGTLAKLYPEAKAVYDEWKDDSIFKGYSDVQKSKFLTSMLNNALEKRQTFTYTVNEPVESKEGLNLTKIKQESIVGKGDRLGNIQDRPLYLIDNSGNIISESMNVQQVIDEYFGGNVEEFTKTTRWQGDVQSDQPLVKSSDVLTFQVDRKGLFGSKTNKVRLLVSQDSHAQAQVREEVFIGNQAMTNSSGKSGPINAQVFPGDSPELIQLLNNNPMLEVRRKPIFLHQDLTEMLEFARKSFNEVGRYTDPVTMQEYSSRDAFDGYVKEKAGEIQRVKSSTKENTVRYEPEVYNYKTNVLIGNKGFWDDYIDRAETHALTLESGVKK